MSGVSGDCVPGNQILNVSQIFSSKFSQFCNQLETAVESDEQPNYININIACSNQHSNLEIFYSFKLYLR